MTAEPAGMGVVGPSGELVVDPATLRSFARGVLSAAGLADQDAGVVADSLVDADLRGIHSHGVTRLGIYVERLRRGGNRAAGRPAIIAEAPALVLLDADDALSQVASARAVEIAVERAGALGCAAVSVRGGSHFGAAGYWARRMAERGLLGLATTNTSPLMAAWGGGTTAIGTNPLAFAFPSSGGDPVVVDVATSESTWGALLNARAAGEPIPDSWALGHDGRPTTNAAEAVEARRLLPFGRHKGYALAVGIELLSGALAGARCLASIADMYGEVGEPMAVGHLFVAVDPRALGQDAPHLATSVHEVQQAINALPPGPGADRVLWPGQLEAERAARREVDGIPLAPAIVRELDAVAEATGVPLPSGAEARRA